MIDVLAGWTGTQWTVFGGSATAGLALLVLLGYLGAAVRANRPVTTTTPLPGLYRDPALAHVRPRPSLQLTERRAALPPPPVITASGEVVELDQTHVDPARVDYAAGGVSSLKALRRVGEGSLIAAEPRVDPDVAAEVGAVLAAVLEDFRIAMEPVERTLRLWNARAHGGVVDQARAQLDAWRINTPTGEWPMVVPDPAREGVAWAITERGFREHYLIGSS